MKRRDYSVGGVIEETPSSLKFSFFVKSGNLSSVSILDDGKDTFQIFVSFNPEVL